MIDWNIIGLVRPDIISIPESIVLSMFGYMFYGLFMWIVLMGLLMYYTVFFDLKRLATLCSRSNMDLVQSPFKEVLSTFSSWVIRGSILLVFFAGAIRLQSTYLISEGSNIVEWLYSDASALISGDGQAFRFGEVAIARSTSLLFLFVTLFVFVWSHLSLGTCRRLLGLDYTSLNPRRWVVAYFCLGMCAFSVVSIGQVVGFSILLVLSLIFAIYCLIRF